MSQFENIENNDEGYVDQLVGTLDERRDNSTVDQEVLPENANEKDVVFSNGKEMLDYLIQLPASKTAAGCGHSFNRTIKVLKDAGKLDEDIREIQKYSKYISSQKTKLHTVIRNLEENDDTELFECVSRAILNQQKEIATVEVNNGSIVSNRWALLAHAMVDSRLNHLLVQYGKKAESGDRPGMLTDGPAKRKLNILNEMLKIINEKIRPELTNPFIEENTCLRNIHPEFGDLKDADMLSALITQLRNAFDTLKINLSKSGTNSDGTVSIATALQFCKSGRVTNLGEFSYYYLMLYTEF